MAYGLIYEWQLDTAAVRISYQGWIDLRKPVGHVDWIGQAGWPNGLRVASRLIPESQMDKVTGLVEQSS